MEVHPITKHFSLIQSYQTQYSLNIYQISTMNTQIPTENKVVKILQKQVVVRPIEPSDRTPLRARSILVT